MPEMLLIQHVRGAGVGHQLAKLILGQLGRITEELGGTALP